MIKRFDTEILGIKYLDKDVVRIYHEDKIYYNAWYILSASAKEDINTKFGSTDGPKVIAAAQEYIKGLGKTKGSSLLTFINEDPMMVCSLGLEPQGVTMPVRWLVGDGDSWIDTGFTPSNTSGMYIKFISLAPSSAFMGVRTANLSKMFAFLRLAANTWRTGYGDNQYKEWGTGDNNPHEMSLIRNVAKFDDQTYTFTTQTFTTMGNALVFGMNNNGAKGGTLTNVAVAKMWDADTPIRNFIPFIGQNRDGMIDLVNMAFHPNQGTGTFGEAYTRNGQPWTPPTP